MNNKYAFIIALLLCLSPAQANALSKKYSSSLIIPSCAKHARYLLPLLKMYEQQTMLPDEVVISLSEYQKVSPDIIEQLKKERWIFPIKLLLYEKKLFAGQNRNNACQEAIGDIFICQDADDIPHPQRIEIITHFFRKYDVDHLMHQMVELDPQDVVNSTIIFKQYALNDIPFLFTRFFKRDIWSGGLYTNGNVAISRFLFDIIQWGSEPRGQDTLFNTKVYELFKKCIAIKVPLYIALPALSSIGKGSELSQEIRYPVHSRSVKEKKHSIIIYKEGVPSAPATPAKNISLAYKAAYSALQSSKKRLARYIKINQRIFKLKRRTV